MRERVTGCSSKNGSRVEVSKAIQLPIEVGAGKDREAQTLLADPARKLVLIQLRNGALLDDHSARFPITIQGVAGKGTLRVGNAAHRLCTRDGCAGRRSSRSQRSGRACNSRLVLSASRIAGRQRHDSALRLEAVSTYRQWPKLATAY